MVNLNTISPECATQGWCSQCRFDDCACDCHLAPDEPDELSVCHHGVGFDEECEDCELEIEDEDRFEEECKADDEYDKEEM